MTDKDIKILIIGDIHGRFFWKEPVIECLEKYPDSKIVFLGDYLDPYEIEWTDVKFDYKENAINNFKEILEIKKKYNDRVILLIGNHDCSYAISTNICNSRCDLKNYETIKKLFLDNWNLFQLAYEETINGTHFIFSHAGIHKGYLKLIGIDNIEEKQIVDYFNNAWIERDDYLLGTLGMYDNYRGYLSYDYGSIVWADVHSWIFDSDILGFQIFGHTQLKSPIKSESFACVDCRECTYITSNGNILKYLNNGEIESYK